MSMKAAQPSRALWIIPPRSAATEAPAVLRTAMQSMVLNDEHPVALEIAGTAQGRQLLVRATSREALEHAAQQLHGRYPQADIRLLEPDEDPLRVDPGETVSAIELQAGGAPYLPLHSWERKELAEVGTDPLLGLLAALDHLPSGMRAVAQLALVPAAPTWSHAYHRQAIEHALEPERQARLLSRGQGGGPSWLMLFLGALVVVAGVLFQTLHIHLPAWIGQALQDVVHQRPLHLTSAETEQLIVGGGGLLLGFFFLVFLFDLLKKRLFPPRPLYDQRLVAKKTQGGAFRARLRLYAVGPAYQPVAYVQPTNATFPTRLWTRVQHQRSERERRRAGVRDRTAILDRLVAAYRQFHLAQGSYFVPRPLAEGTALRSIGGTWGQKLNRSSHLLSAESAADMWHPPTGAALAELARVEAQTMRRALVPPALLQSATGVVIGVSEHAGHRIPVALPPALLHSHTLVVGISGSGKSTFLEQLAAAGMQQGGVWVIDPHNDLVEHVLLLVPPERAKDVVLIDLADLAHVPGLNPLDVTLGRPRDKAVDDLLRAFAHVWATSWGPRMGMAFQRALETLIEANRVSVARDTQNGPEQQYTLLDVVPVLTDQSFCRTLLQDVRDDYLRRWWSAYYEPMKLMEWIEVINPVLSKVAKFESEVARLIVGQGHSTLDFARLLRERKIVLIKLGKDTIGGETAGILAATMVGLLQTALEEQGHLEEARRARPLILLDEFQLFAGVDYGAIAELRKFGATLVLSTQSSERLQKLDEHLLPTVLSNVSNLVVFRLSDRDARIVHGEIHMEQEDITYLPRYTAYLRVESYPTFSCAMGLPLQQALSEKQAKDIRQRSQADYARPAAAVAAALKSALARIELVKHPQPSHMGAGAPPPDPDDAYPHARAAGSGPANAQGPQAAAGGKAEERRAPPPPDPGQSGQNGTPRAAPGRISAMGWARPVPPTKPPNVENGKH